MGEARTSSLEEEARQTVDGLLEHFDVPSGTAKEVEQLCRRDDSLEALDVLLETV